MGKRKCNRVNLFTSENNPRKREEGTPSVSFILWLEAFVFFNFLEFSIHLTFLYAGVKVIHVLSRYIGTVWLFCSGVRPKYV